jgi:hypothetical protein
MTPNLVVKHESYQYKLVLVAAPPFNVLLYVLTQFSAIHALQSQPVN